MNQKLLKLYNPIRTLTTFLLMLSMALTGFSGIVLWTYLKGYWGVRATLLFGFTRAEWGQLHGNVSVLTLTLVFLHLTLEWRIFASLVKSLRPKRS